MISYINCNVKRKEMELSDLILEVGSISTWSANILDKVLTVKKYRITDADTATLLVKIVTSLDCI